MNMRATMLLVAGLAGCATGPTIQVTKINAYRAYGEYHPVTQDEAMVARAATANPGAYPIHLFQEAFPPGIELTGNTFGVKDGYHHRILGKYAYSPGTEVTKDALVVKVKQMCVATGANAAILNFLLIPNDHQDRAQGVETILIELVDEPAAAPAPARADNI